MVDQKNISQEHSNFTCPICRSIDRVTKVSAIYGSGKYEGIYSGSAVSFTAPLGSKSSPSISYTPINISGENVSILSKKLSPPSTPKKKSSGCLFAFLLFIAIGATPSLIAGSVVILSDIQEPMDAIGGIIVFGILIGIWSLVVFIIKRKNKLSKKNYEHEVELYNKIKPIWDRLYYCFRDDIVFNPETNQYALVDNMADLLQ